ncbi:MAG: NAD(P)/FAD-dependent oxidoreductase [Nitrospinota bacterium]
MTSDLLPLADGDTVCILGGGPGGAACAIALKREAAKVGKNIEVVIFEQKKFSEHRQYNQCIGVLSPPLESILLDNLEIRLPQRIILNEIDRYCLHSDNENLNLLGNAKERSLAVNRSKFDAFMLEQAKASGAIVHHLRATGIEFLEKSVMVYSEGKNVKASVVVGAFGLDEGSCKIFEQDTHYAQPGFLNTIITRISPGREFLTSMGPVIHAFLLSNNGLEFGAISPKDDHISINIAGKKVSSKVMLDFLRSPQVQKFLPPHVRREKPLHYFKGKFPIEPAKHFYGHRYVTIGDASGLIRPFKGKGINTASITAIHAAKTIIHHGVSHSAFKMYAKACKDMTDDLPYGRLLRRIANLSSHYRFMDYVLKIAEKNEKLMACLFNSVSGHSSYKEIFRETASVQLGFQMMRAFACRIVKGK